MSYADLRYDEVRQKSVHNCFQRHEGVLDQFLYWRVRSFEVDIHASKPHAPDLHGDWYVFHETWDSNTTVETLGGFLRLLRAARFAVPKHEVITVFLDLKDDLDRGDASPHSGDALDALLREHLGDSILTPGELLGGADSMQAAVAGGWPPLAELRGRFLFVLTGKTEYMDRYAADNEDAARRVAFVSRKVVRESQIPGPSHVVVYNMDAGHVGLAAKVRAHRLLSRAYYVNSSQAWSAARTASCHHIATDKVNAAKDRWSRTSDALGWPFEPLDEEAPGVVEPGETGGVWSLSGDIWARKDSFYFHYRACPPSDADHTYDALVSSPNSEVEDWTKAALMARATLHQDAPYFGVFRMGEKAGLRVQYRDRVNAPTVKRELATPPGFEADTLALVRLQLSHGGRRADGFASVDGSEWIHIARWGFAEPLVLHGLAVSGQEVAKGVKFMFAMPGTRPPFDSGRIVGPLTGRRGWSDWDGERRWRVRAWHE